ncbi:MAG TPA: hypothetical protein VJN39_02490 [Gemmatimonadales bacterium]|nr:hypothetical protein [Gemmatimonadales bacterium]
MRRRTLLYALAALVPAAARAQTAAVPFTDALRAYKDLDFDLAAGLLRRDLARLRASNAPLADQTKGLLYLGAADLFRGRRDSAVAVFRRLVMLDPRYRPDRMLFPPEVTSVFDSVRTRTKVVSIQVPRDTEVSAGSGGGGAWSAWVFASSFQSVEVTLRYEDGAPFRFLYAGPIGDSLRVPWNGLDAADQLPPVNRVLLRVASRAPTGELTGILQLPLDLKVVRSDTVPWPPPLAKSQLLPERAGSGPATRALFGGLLVSGAVAALPAVVGGSHGSSGPRLAVVGAVEVAGLLGYILHRPGRPLAENVRANKARRDAWQRSVERVSADNARRRSDIRLSVHAGEVSAMQPRGL